MTLLTQYLKFKNLLNINFDKIMIIKFDTTFSNITKIFIKYSMIEVYYERNSKFCYIFVM